jgi:hypothetical protein
MRLSRTERMARVSQKARPVSGFLMQMRRRLYWLMTIRYGMMSRHEGYEGQISTQLSRPQLVIGSTPDTKGSTCTVDRAYYRGKRMTNTRIPF